MRRRSWILAAIVAILVISGASVGIAQAQGGPSPTDTTPAQLIANVIEHAADVTVISGDVTWTNDLLGLSMLPAGRHGPADLSALLSGGSGRLWIQEGKARLEIQGATGDVQIIADGAGVWIYSSAANTATRYSLPPEAAERIRSGSAADDKAPGSTASAVDLIAAVTEQIEKLAPHASLTLAEPVEVAGRDCYVLVMTPTAATTVFGAIEIAIDAETFAPLRVEIYAKGAEKPVLAAGFTAVSYRSVNADVFTFTPPPGATVEHRELNLPAMDLFGHPSTGPGTKPQAEPKTKKSKCGPLTIAEAAAKAGFTPLRARPGASLPTFKGAYVIPAKEVDLRVLMDTLRGEAAVDGLPAPDYPEVTGSLPVVGLPSGPVTVGPVVVQRYGEGFGTIVLIEAKVPAEMSAQLAQVLAFVPFVSKSGVGDTIVYRLDCALGSLAVWNKDGSLLLAGGSVSSGDLARFVAEVR